MVFNFMIKSMGKLLQWPSIYRIAPILKGFPGSSVGKESACKAGDLGSIPGLGRSPGEGNGNPLQYSCLENPMDREAWQATVHGVPRVVHDSATKPSPQALWSRSLKQQQSSERA